MKKNKRLRSNKGSITLFVLISCLFFLGLVVSVGVYLKNKQNNVQSQYRQIKSSYEQDVGNETEVYDNLTNQL